MAARDALGLAKRLRGTLGRLEARRERQVQKASSDFQLDLLEVIDDVDDGILGLVRRALSYDATQHHLQLALQMAIDERNERRRRLNGAIVIDLSECETERPPSTLTAVEAAAVMRSSPPPRFESFEIEDEPGALADLPSPMESDDAPPAPFGESFERLAQPGAVGGYRYPEPGEPARMLDDGSIVAIDDASAPA